MFPSRFLNEQLATSRYGSLAETYAESLTRGDPLADAAIDSLHQLGHGAWWEAVQDALTQGPAAIANLPPEVSALLGSLPPIPSEAEQALYEQATTAIVRTGDSVGIALQNAALLIDYWSPAFAKPLVLTGSLLDDTGHRLARTAAWWIEVHKAGGLRRDQDGFKTTVHVRLVHAFVRRMALKSGHWDTEAWGQPINQGDLLFQVVGFSWLILRSLRRMGYQINSEDQALYYRLWRYLAAILGVDATLLPLINDEDCERLWGLWLLTNPGPDENSAKLSIASLKAVANSFGTGWLNDHVQYPLMCGSARWLLGNRIGDGLGIPRTFFTALLPWTYRPVVQVSEFFEAFVPNHRVQAAAQAVRGLVTANVAMGIMPEGTGVVIEPQRLANLTQFAAVAGPPAPPTPPPPSAPSPEAGSTSATAD